ncbi:hypothetical protein BDN70DRAFT_925272 [Pholiota conissans]|uniref:F-box domain-containing protein n=1 Tax=Pholiota conissans TaxID=109636 RepID=A0A9P5YSP2_9AGAR|nr:hypothetical protein BDN70DRAFT_925272 [Pholiota conissans]
MILNRILSAPYALSQSRHAEVTESDELNSSSHSILSMLWNLTGNRKRKARDYDTDLPAQENKRAKQTHEPSSKLLQMPMELKLEILSYVNPLDLINLAQSTKALHEMLMDRSATSTWEKARSNVIGLPDRPTDMSEPQYAHLMFVNRCSFCYKRSLHSSYYSRVKACEACIESDIFLPMADYFQISRNTDYPKILNYWLPVMKVLKNDIPVHYMIRKIDNQWKQEYAALEVDPIAKFKWILEKLDALYIRNKHALDCDLWSIFNENDPSDANMKLFSKRRNEIMDYIEKSPCRDALYKLAPVYPNPLPCIEDVWSLSDPLTEESFRKLEESLTKTLAIPRRDHAFSEASAYYEPRRAALHKIYDAGIKNLPFDATYPSLAAFYRITRLHDCMDYSKTGPDALRIPFNDVIELWRNHVKNSLTGVIREDCPDYDFDPFTVLDLATTFFTCTFSTEFHTPCHSMRTDQTMNHRCCWPSDNTLDDDPGLAAFESCFGSALWFDCVGSVQFSQMGLKVMRGVVEMCGLDPLVATGSQMDALDPIIECHTCNSDEGRAMLTWREVVEHQITTHNSTDITSLRIIGERETAEEIRTLIKWEQIRALSEIELKYGVICRHCRHQCSYRDYEEHLEIWHEIYSKIKYEDLIFSISENRVPPLYRYKALRTYQSSNECSIC